jgi:hypothetical protein
MAEISQSIQALVSFEVDITPTATVSTVRPPAGNKFLAPKAHTAVSTISRGNPNRDLIDELHRPLRHMLTQDPGSLSHEKAPYGTGLFTYDRLYGFGLDRTHAHELAIPVPFGLKHHPAVDLGEQGMITTKPNVLTRVKTRTTLPDQNVPSTHHLTAETLYAKSLGLGVTAVTCTATRLFVCHCLNLRSSACGDTGDLHFGELLPVSQRTLIVVAPPEFDSGNLLTLRMTQHGRGNLTTREDRRPDFDVTAIRNHQYLVKLDGGTFFRVQLLDPENFSVGDAILFAPSFDNGVHAALSHQYRTADLRAAILTLPCDYVKRTPPIAALMQKRESCRLTLDGAVHSMRVSLKTNRHMDIDAIRSLTTYNMAAVNALFKRGSVPTWCSSIS